MADDDVTQQQARRQAALRCMEKFADKNGVAKRVWYEHDCGDEVRFTSEPDGRGFAVGYRK